MPCRAVTWILVTTIMCLKWELLSSVMINGRPHAWISATTWELPNMMLRCKDLFWFSMFPFTWVCCHTHSGHAAAAAAKSLRPHRRQPTRLPCPWDSPGQEHWSGLPFPSAGNLLDPRIEPGVLHCKQIFFFFLLS